MKVRKQEADQQQEEPVCESLVLETLGSLKERRYTYRLLRESGTCTKVPMYHSWAKEGHRRMNTGEIQEDRLAKERFSRPLQER